MPISPSKLNPEDLKNAYVSISLVDDKKMQELNKKHRGKDYPTDVLSFHMEERDDEGRFYLGDLVVNFEQAERQAKEYDNSTEEEISELVGHGMLHLLGVHHEHDDH